MFFKVPLKFHQMSKEFPLQSFQGLTNSRHMYRGQVTWVPMGYLVWGIHATMGILRDIPANHTIRGFNQQNGDVILVIVEI